MRMRKMNKFELAWVDKYLAEAEALYGTQKDNSVTAYVQEKMINAGLRVKVPIKDFSDFSGIKSRVPL